MPVHPRTEIVLTLLQEARAILDRAEGLLRPAGKHREEDLDPKNPLNKTGVNLTARGVEVCYRLFDAGKTRYAVAQALDISYAAASNRMHTWEKLGGKNRKRQPL